MELLENNLDLPLRAVLAKLQERVLLRTRYRGIKTVKCPLDMWVYQEIILDTAPDFVVEIGCGNGGTLLALADMLRLIGGGTAIGVDIAAERVVPIVRNYPNVRVIKGSACSVVDKVQAIVGHSRDVMVIEDSSHEYHNTLNVLRLYSELVGPGHYFIVEDTICHHGLDEGPSPGPMEAVEDFLKENTRFKSHRTREDFIITWNPKGYLRAMS